jgi:hypothetical protein
VLKKNSGLSNDISSVKYQQVVPNETISPVLKLFGLIAKVLVNPLVQQSLKM